MIRISSLEDVAKYDVPVYILEDINKRMTDWIASGGALEDDYIKQQFRYVERYLNFKSSQQ